MKAVHMTRLFTSYATVTMAQYAMTLSRPAHDLRDANIDSIAPTLAAFVGNVVFEKKIDKKCFARRRDSLTSFSGHSGNPATMTSKEETMKEPTAANTAGPNDVENLRKRLEDLHKGNAFLNLRHLAIAATVGITFGLLTYWSLSNVAGSLLTGLVWSIAWLALSEAKALRKHTEAILAVLDNETAASKEKTR